MKKSIHTCEIENMSLQHSTDNLFLSMTNEPRSCAGEGSAQVELTDALRFRGLFIELVIVV